MDDHKDLSDAYVLVVDDQDVDRAVLVQQLQSLGCCRAVGVRSAREALAAIEKEQPDLVLSDIVMPGMSGLELCSRIREDILTKDLPLIALTSVHGAENKEAIFKVGASNFISKPISKSELAVMVNYHLQHGHAPWPVEAVPTQEKEVLILVVDDQDIDRTIIMEMLRRAGYCNLVAAEDGEDALDKVKAHKPDLIILDILMPKKNGLDVCRELRMNPETWEVPILIQTSATDKEHREAIFDVGANDLMCKPVTRSELLSLVSMHLESRNSSTAQVSISA